MTDSERSGYRVPMAVPAREFGGEQTFIIARRIKQRRLDLDLTQEQVQERLRELGMDTTDGTISNFEHGSGLSMDRLPILCVALECTPTYLLALTNNPRKWTPDLSLREAVTTRAKFNGRPATLTLHNGTGTGTTGPRQPPIVVAR